MTKYEKLRIARQIECTINRICRRIVIGVGADPDIVVASAKA